MGKCNSTNKNLYSSWTWTKDELIETFEQGIPDLKKWDPNDEAIRRIVHKDKIRTSMKIGSYKGYYIPPPEHNIWKIIGLRGRSKVCVILCCTQLLWGAVLQRFYNSEEKDIITGIYKPDLLKYALKENQSYIRKIHVTDGALYTMMNFDCIDTTTDSMLRHFTLCIIVKVTWSVIKGNLKKVEVFILYSKPNNNYWENRMYL